MLTLLIIIPILGSIMILPMANTTESQEKMKLIALLTSLLNLIISLFIWFQFDSSTTQYQFINFQDIPNITNSIEWSAYELSRQFSFKFGIDGISLYFVLLTTFITPVALLSNYKNITENIKAYLIIILLLETLQICTFLALDLLLFYIFFESVLPLLFILIILFGHGNERFRTAFLFFLYTLAGSLPMLLSILMIYSYIGSTDFQLISLYSISLDSQKVLFIGFFIAFAVKTPLYPFTIWLPKAHALAPLGGSIILAGVILKLATYLMLRVIIPILPDALYYFGPLVQTIAVVTIIYASLSTLVQQDSKRLIAYSSIAHMGVALLGLCSNSIIGIEGAILLGIGHGLVSPALFICVGGIIYDRTGTRLIKYIRGLVTYMPVFTILFFIFTLCNCGIPLSINWVSEQLALIGIWQINPIIAALGASGIFLSACFSIYLFNRVSFGNLSNNIKPLKDINRREYFLLLALLLPTFIFGICPVIILNNLHSSITNILYSI